MKISSFGKPVNCLILKIPGWLFLEQRKLSRVVTLIGCSFKIENCLPSNAWFVNGDAVVYLIYKP